MSDKFDNMTDKEFIEMLINIVNSQKTMINSMYDMIKFLGDNTFNTTTEK